MTFVVPVLTLVISESQSAQLLFPPQYFLSVAKPGTQSSPFHTYKYESEQDMSSLDHSHIPPPKICYQAEREHGICVCLHMTRKKARISFHAAVTKSTFVFVHLPVKMCLINGTYRAYESILVLWTVLEY